MGWIWSCLGGKNVRQSRDQADVRRRPSNTVKDSSSEQPLPRRNSHSSSVQLIPPLEEARAERRLHSIRGIFGCLRSRSISKSKVETSENSVDSSVVLGSSFAFGSSATLSAPKVFVPLKAGRIWQPLSTVWESDSTRSSREDLSTSREDLRASREDLRASREDSRASWEDLRASKDDLCSSKEDLRIPSISQLSVCDIVDYTTKSQQTQCIFSGTKEGNICNSTDIGEVLEDDLFTLPAQQLHQNYSPSDDASRVNWAEHELPSGPIVKCWTSNDENDLGDIVPILCESPAFSPKMRVSRRKLINVKDFRQKEYPRDKYFKELGLVVDESLPFSDSCTYTDFRLAEKENIESSDTYSNTMGLPHRDSPVRKNSNVALDMSFSQCCGLPVLSSIENLPVWIDSLGISVSEESQNEGRKSSDMEENLREQQNIPDGGSNLKCVSRRIRGARQTTKSSPRVEFLEAPGLSKCHDFKHDLLTLEQMLGSTYSIGSFVPKQPYHEICATSMHSDLSTLERLEHFENDEFDEIADDESRLYIDCRVLTRNIGLDDDRCSGQYKKRKLSRGLG